MKKNTHQAASAPAAAMIWNTYKQLVDPGDGLRIEDPFVFWSGDHYEMVCKDLTGEIAGEYHAGVHLLSDDGVDWTLAPQPIAWSRKISWDDGSTTLQSNIERPFILFQDGQPAFLFAATADGPGPKNGVSGFHYAENTWNMVIPLKQDMQNRSDARNSL